MGKRIVTPMLGVNAKSYMWGDELFEIAQYCEKIAVENDISITMNVPFVDIYRIAKMAKHVIITAQGVDAIEPGGTMGGALPEAIKSAGADAAIINHAARPMTLTQVVHSIERCKDVGLYTFVCADSLEEAKMIATLNPTGVICEQTKLIGSGVLASPEYLQSTTKAVKDINPEIIVMQGAGIKSGEDIYRNIKYGSETGGGASGIFCSSDPKATIEDYVEGLLRAKKDFGSRIAVKGDK